MCDVAQVLIVCEVACAALEADSGPGVRRAKFKELAEVVRTITAVIARLSRAQSINPSWREKIICTYKIFLVFKSLRVRGLYINLPCIYRAFCEINVLGAWAGDLAGPAISRLGRQCSE